MKMKNEKRQMKNRVGLFLFLLLPGILRSQDATFVASADRAEVGAGEQFEVSFTLSGGNVSGARNFQPPDFGQFVVLSGPHQSTSMQIVNGQFSGSVTYSYVLYARQPGNYTIGAASVELRGKKYSTEPIAIRVTQGRPQQQTPASPGTPQDAQNLEENLFVRAVVNKQRVRQGEQITVTYKLYTRLSVNGYDITKAPAYQGFWAEDIEQPRQPVVNTEVWEGKQYRVATIKRTALFPTQSGSLKIAPLEVRCAVQTQSRRRSNDPFDSFFNDPFFQRFQTVEYTFTSNTVTIHVDPLPSPPAGFSGAVGVFTLNAGVDKRDVKAGDPITYKLTVSGTGNVKLLTLPPLSVPLDFEAYEPKLSESISRDGGVIRGSKTAEYLLIPKNAGQRRIEPVSFTYFDLGKGEYVTLRTPRFDVTVAPGKELAAGGVVSAKADVRLLGEDIRFLKLSLGDLKRREDESLLGGGFVLALLLPPVLFLAAFAYRKRIEKIYGDLPSLRSQQAGKEASKRLKHARKVLNEGDTATYHAEIAKALFGYLRDKLKIPPASLSLDEATARLKQAGVDHTLIENVRSCIENAEFARFAPGADTQSARQDLLDSASRAIESLERSLNGRR
ncbi:MAG TPA: BatD family protein [Bacteroidota bacterium]|nr:BatD family protein [Bacteroidota bacterium]